MIVRRGHLLAISSVRRGLAAAFRTCGSVRLKWSTDIYANPIKELEPMLQVPLSSIAEDLFNPSTTEVDHGRSLFYQRLTVYKSEIDPEELPTLGQPEVKNNVDVLNVFKHCAPTNDSTNDY